MYLKLVKRFPLIHIRDEAHLNEALDLLNELLRQDRDQGTQDYLNVLTDLVAAYEDEHVPIPNVSESEVLRELMRSNRLSQMELAKAVGIAQSAASAVLTGIDRSRRGRSSRSPSSSASRRQRFFRATLVAAPGERHLAGDCTRAHSFKEIWYGRSRDRRGMPFALLSAASCARTIYKASASEPKDDAEVTRTFSLN